MSPNLLTAAFAPRRDDSDVTRMVMRPARLRSGVATVSLLVLAGCGGAEAGNGLTGPASAAPGLTTIRVSLPSDTIEVGATVTATAIGLDQSGRTITTDILTWSTASPGIATVDQVGLVTGVVPGQTMLVASTNGRTGQRLVTIVPPAVNRIALAPGAARLTVGGTLQLSAVAQDAGSRPMIGRKIDFTTSDASKASVTPAGLVTALSPGAVTITATADRATASTALTVTATPDSVATVIVNAGAGVMTVGGNLQLAAMVKDANDNVLSGRVITWAVTGLAGRGVAVVSDAGLVTALAPGAIVVEAFSEGRHGSATITVRDNTDSNIVVTFAAPTDNQVVGDTLLVIVNVRSPHALSSVVAEAGPYRKQVVLALRPVGALGGIKLWVGSIDITDLATGPYPVTVTATDVTGARGVGTRQFMRDTRTGKGGSSVTPHSK